MGKAGSRLGKQGQEEEGPGGELPLSCPAGKCWEWESEDVFPNCPFEKPLKYTSGHILVFRESFFPASFPNLLKPPCRESIHQYTWRHSHTPSRTTDSLQVVLTERHWEKNHLLYAGTVGLNSSTSLLCFRRLYWRHWQGATENGRGCKQSLKFLVLPEKKKINPSRAWNLNFVRQRMLPPAA